MVWKIQGSLKAYLKTNKLSKLICNIISAIYFGGLDARWESSENWNNLLFFGKSEVGSFFGKVSFSTRHKNDKLDCTLQRTCIGTILFFCLFFRHLTLPFLAGFITYSSQSVSFTFFLLTFFIFYFINVLILFKITIIIRNATIL